MSWFERHRNWTLVLLCYIGSFVALMVGYWVAIIFVADSDCAGLAIGAVATVEAKRHKWGENEND